MIDRSFQLGPESFCLSFFSLDGVQREGVVTTRTGLWNFLLEVFFIEENTDRPTFEPACSYSRGTPVSHHQRSHCNEEAHAAQFPLNSIKTILASIEIVKQYLIVLIELKGNMLQSSFVDGIEFHCVDTTLELARHSNEKAHAVSSYTIHARFGNIFYFRTLLSLEFRTLLNLRKTRLECCYLNHPPPRPAPPPPY